MAPPVPLQSIPETVPGDDETEPVNLPPSADLTGIAADFDDPPTSLVTNGRTVDGNQVCLRSRIDFYNVLTGQVIRGRCGASFCPACAPVSAWWKAQIISHGGATGNPERYFVLTNAPEDWPKLRQKMRDLRRILARRHGSFEQAWTVEVGSKTGMRHVNVLQKGTYIPQHELQDTWGAIVHVQKIRDTPGKLGTYALKEAQRVSGYALKETGDGQEPLKRFLENNGGRFVHLSKNYLGGLTQSEVKAELLDARGGGGEWIPVSRTDSWQQMQSVVAALAGRT